MPTTEESREFLYATHSDNPNVSGGNGSLNKNPCALAINHLNRTADKTKKELNGMLGNFEWYGKWAAAQGVVKGVDFLSQAAGTAHTLSQNLSLKQILYPVGATSVGRMVTGKWPKVQKAFDIANVASSAFAVYKKCDSLQPGHPTGIVTALSQAGNRFVGNYPLIVENRISQAIIRSSVGQKIPGAMSSLYTKFDSLKYGRTTMFMAASWVGSQLLQKTPLIKHIANHPLANNILWGMRLGSTAYLASPLVATVRAWNAEVVKMRLAQKAVKKTAIKPPASTPLTQATLDQDRLTFQTKAEAFEIIDGNKMCLPASAVQAFAGMGLERSQFTQPSEGPLLNEIREMTEKYTDQLVEKSRIAYLAYKNASQAVLLLAPKLGVLQTTEEIADFHTAMNNKESTAVACDEAAIAIISNNSQMLSSENKTKFATGLSEINTRMLRSKIHGRFVELLNDSSVDAHQKMALFCRGFSNHQELLKDTLLSITAEGLSGADYASMQMRIENLITGAAPSDPIDPAEKRDWLARAYDRSRDNRGASGIAWDKIATETKDAALPAPAAWPINLRIAQEDAAQAKAKMALDTRSARDSTLIDRIIEADRREDTVDSYPAVFVAEDEDDQSLLIGHSLSGDEGDWASRYVMRGAEIESIVRTKLANTADGEAIRYIDDGSEERLYAKLPSRFVQDLGLKDPAKLHAAEELIAERDPYSEKLVYKCPSDTYKVGTNSDHELTAAVLLGKGLKVQSDLMTKFAAGTLFLEPLEEIEGMIGFLDLCKNHRVTRLTSGNVPSFLKDEAWQNHWAGYSVDRDAIVTQLADHYAIQQTQARVQAKLRNGSEFVEPRVGIAQMQEGVLLNAMKRLEELVNRTPSPVDYERDGTTMSRNAFRKDFTDLKNAVNQALKIHTEVPNLFAACQELVPDTRIKQQPNSRTRGISVLKKLYEAAGSMRHALVNPNVEPVIRATLKDTTSNELQIELNACFAEIDKAYADFVDYAGYNEDLLAASDSYKFAIASGKRAEIDARRYYYENYFESLEIPSAASHAWNGVKSKVNSGTQAAQSGARAAGLLAGGATAGAIVAVVAGASAMFGAGLRRVSSAVGHAPVSIAGPAPSAPDETLPPPYAPSPNYILPEPPPATAPAGPPPPARSAFLTSSKASSIWENMPVKAFYDMPTYDVDVKTGVYKLHRPLAASAMSASPPGSPVGKLLDQHPEANVWMAEPVDTSSSSVSNKPFYHLDDERRPYLPEDEVPMALNPHPVAPLAPDQSHANILPQLKPLDFTEQAATGNVVVAQPVAIPPAQNGVASPMLLKRAFSDVDLEEERELPPQTAGKSSLQRGTTPPSPDDDDELPSWG